MDRLLLGRRPGAPLLSRQRAKDDASVEFTGRHQSLEQQREEALHVLAAAHRAAQADGQREKVVNRL